MEAVVCHRVSQSVSLWPHIFSCRWTLQLVWFEVSAFCETINTGSSPGLLLLILLLFYVMEILHLWISRTGPFMYLNRLQVI